MKNTLVVKADRETLEIRLVRETEKLTRSIRIQGATKVEARHSKVGNQMTVTMWAEDCEEEIEISETMAQAILTRDHQMQLSFLDNDDATQLRALLDWLQQNRTESPSAPGHHALLKLLAVLEKREEIPF